MNVKILTLHENAVLSIRMRVNGKINITWGDGKTSQIERLRNNEPFIISHKYIEANKIFDVSIINVSDTFSALIGGDYDPLSTANINNYKKAESTFHLSSGICVLSAYENEFINPVGLGKNAFACESSLDHFSGTIRPVNLMSTGILQETSIKSLKISNPNINRGFAMNCRQLTSVFVACDLVNIDSYAFAGCTSLKYFTSSSFGKKNVINAVNIRKAAFKDTALNNAVIYCTNISEEAFKYSELEYLELHCSGKIGIGAFGYNKLREVRFHVIPEKLDRAFTALPTNCVFKVKTMEDAYRLRNACSNKKVSIVIGF